MQNLFPYTPLAWQKVVADMKSRLKDPDLARLFENTFPNTLDTTVKYFNAVRREDSENIEARGTDSIGSP